MRRRCDAVSNNSVPNFDDSHFVKITSRPIFDDVTLCKHVTAEENAFIVFNSFSYTKNVIFAINIVIAQIAIRLRVCRQVLGVYVMISAQGHNAVTPVRLEPAALRSRVKRSTTEPLRSLFM